MKQFMDKDFLLETETAKKLFDACKDMPIIDYHCHLSPQEIYEDTPYDNVGQLWLKGDHYKWRLMRACGVEEKYVTGDASDYEKFEKFASIMPLCIGNPVYHWAHLELQRYFDCTLPLNAKNAKAIWDQCQAKMASGAHSVRAFIEQSNVEAVCTTDDPIDSLQWHAKIAADPTFNVKVLPSFRPDKVYGLDREDYVDYVAKLSEAAGVMISSAKTLIDALLKRVDYFYDKGCVITDHASQGFPYSACTDEQAEDIFARRMKGEAMSADDLAKFFTFVMTALAKKYNAKGMIMQLHIGALRNNNKAMFERLGPDTGYDSVCDNLLAVNLGAFLGSLGDEVPKTVLYTLNASDFFVLATMAGNFTKAGDRSHIQLGTSWWFLDHIDGMLQQMHTLANVGVLGNFIGMLTDSRSFLSYPRHEYFRRIVCNLIGGWVESGMYPDEPEVLEQIVRGISHDNIKAYMGI